MNTSVHTNRNQGKLLGLVLGCLFLVGTTLVSADEPPLPLGGEIVIPDYTEGDQMAPDLAVTADGGFIVVWQSHGEDGDGFGIMAQAHHPDGSKIGPPIAVNAHTEGSQIWPAVASDDEGRFAIAWQGPDSESTTGIFVRVFTPEGVARTGELPVHDGPSGHRSQASLAMSEAGRVLVVWQADDGAGQGIWGRLFADDGTPLTGELQINSTTGGNQQNPQVRNIDETGGFVVVWEGPDLAGSGIYMRLLSEEGLPVTGELQVNEVTDGYQRNPALAVSGLDVDPLDRNVIVVAWQSHDDLGTGIYARAYHDDGVPLGSQQRVSDTTGMRQSEPSVTVDNGLDPSGMDFTITWTESPVAGLEGGPAEPPPVVIHGRRLGNVADTSTFQEATTAEVFQISEDGDSTGVSVVAAADDGDFVVIWQSNDQDGSGSGVMGRLFAGQPLLVDGFESGDTSRWSETVP